MVDRLFLVRDLNDQVARSMSAAMVAGARAATAATSKQALALADVFARDVAASERKAFFEKLGTRAQGSIIRSYQGHSRGPSGYRSSGRNEKTRRYAGGRMLNALKNPNNIFEATAKGITFLPNPKQLDREARQWYRLNFGAAPGFGRAPGRFDVTISNLHLFSIGFEAGPSEPFRIPRGFWVEGGEAVPPGAPGTSEFWPARQATRQLGLQRGRGKEAQAANNFFPGRRVASGIKAEHFLDAGLRRFTKDLGDPGESGIGLRGLYFKFYRAGLASVKPTRPPTIRVNGRIV